ncbi:MAG: DUF2207 domain-containing protein [Candidatus Elulimicrobiales bacterium]|nr:DUF2207 domain-containing protein [Candidatus Elulimicrobiales bacterium]
MKKVFLINSIFIVFLLNIFSFNIVFAQTNLNNFTISNYEVDLYLSKDAENHSILTTVEKITANFPDFDQNRGITRDFVRGYNGHDTDLKVVSVTDENGVVRPYTWTNSSLIRIAGEEYVHGKNTYVITFTQRDVTRYYSDTDKDEFYWDALGVDSLVPVSNAVVRLHIDESLKPDLRTDLYCYAGPEGQNNTPCNVENFTVTAQNLPPHNGVTIAMGFEKGTFLEIEPDPNFTNQNYLNQGSVQGLDFFNIIEWFVPTFISVLGLLFFGLIVSVASKKSGEDLNLVNSVWRDLPIIPQYLRPKNYSVLMSASLLETDLTYTRLGNRIVAQIIDWAVQKYILIYQTKKKSFLSSGKYRFEIINSFENMKEEEKLLAKLIFEDSFDVLGDSVTLDDIENRLNPFSLVKASKLTNPLIDLKLNIEDIMRTKTNLYEPNPLREIEPTKNKFTRFFSKIFSTMFYPEYRKTERFLEVRHYLKGLEEYIRVAEKTRFEMTQSPETVEKIGDITNDMGARLKLYESLLPYAILFRQERKWVKELGKLYELNNVQPDWSVGTSSSALIFSSMMRDLSSSLAESTGSSSDFSSSSGGSSGGGSSGGGGGGGGVGGA